MRQRGGEVESGPCSFSRSGGGAGAGAMEAQRLSGGQRPECRTNIPRRAPREQWAEYR